MNHNLFRAILMLIFMAISEIGFFISNFELTFLVLMILSAILAFFELSEYSEELNKEEEMNEFIQEV